MPFSFPRKCSLCYHEKKKLYFLIIQQISHLFKMPRVFAPVLNIFSRKLSEKQIFSRKCSKNKCLLENCWKHTYKYFRIVCQNLMTAKYGHKRKMFPFVSHFAEKFLLFRNKLKEKSTLLIFAKTWIFLSRFSRFFLYFHCSARDWEW